MLKSKPPDCSPSGNVKKYLSYREAWAPIKKSQQQEFYLEAVTLTESIIRDRLMSYLTSAKFIKSNPKPEKHLSFSDLIKRSHFKSVKIHGFGVSEYLSLIIRRSNLVQS